MGTILPAAPAAPAAPAPTATDQQPDKIDLAIQEAGRITGLFLPQASAAIEAGEEVEPLIHGLVSMFVGLFKHHATKK